MKSLKNSRAGSWFAICSIILAIASMVSYFVLSMDGEKSPSIVYVITALAVVAQIAVFLFCRTKPGKNYNTASLLAAVFSAYALEQMLLGRLEWLGGLAAHNASLAPMHMSFMVTIVLYVLTILTAIIATFCKQVQE